MWLLKSSNPTETHLVFRVGEGTIKTVGRATRADFILDAALVSRLHCRLTAGPDGSLVIEDLKSTNGTFVNDKRVKRAPLKPGDLVRIGRVELAVEKG